MRRDMNARSDYANIDHAVVRSAQEIDRTAPRAFGSITGVQHRVLWTDGESIAGVMTVEHGCRLGLHVHRANHHHLWMVSGRAAILGRTVGPGSYVHIPSGVEHDIDATSTEGCTVYYLYQAPASRALPATQHAPENDGGEIPT
jgi:quercetin dioxygenase-like cupin family protein